MKVAAIVYQFPSVSETFVLGQLMGLKTLGCEVTVFADGPDRSARTEGHPGDESGVEYFGLPFKSFREKYGTFVSSTTPETIAPPARARLPRVGNLATHLRLAFEARAFKTHTGFDVVCAHFGPNGVRAVRLRAKNVFRCPIVTSFYGYDVGRPTVRSGYRQLFAEGDWFIALSEEMRSRLIDLGCPSDRLTVHRLGVDPDRFNLQPPKKRETLEILSVARLVQKKGIEYGLRAAAILKSHNVRFRYTIVGDGPLRKQLEALAAELGLTRSVRWAGALAHSKVAGLMAESDVLLAPSVTASDGDAEGTPVAILEGAAAGLAVIASRHAGIPEIVADGVSGFLVPERDPSAIAAKLMELRDNRQQLFDMARAGRKIVTDRHDIRVLNRDLLRLLEQIRDKAAGC